MCGHAFVYALACSSAAGRDDCTATVQAKRDRGYILLIRVTIIRRYERFCRAPLWRVMATLLPPPKRQKVYHGVPEPKPEPIQPSPNVVVQFVNEHDGASIAPAVNLPANVARETLEVLVNQLRTKASRQDTSIHSIDTPITQEDEDHVPFAFHVALPEDATKSDAPTRIVISKSIQDDVLSHSSQAFSEENILIVRCAPQSVFKVRLATRCSSTLSGM